MILGFAALASMLAGYVVASTLRGYAVVTLLATDPPYGVSLDPTWRDRVYNELGPAEKPYMTTRRKLGGGGGAGGRAAEHTNTTRSADAVPADFASEALAVCR